MSGHAAVLETVCANCGGDLGGAFCQACGQKAAGPDVSLHDFFHDALHEFAHVDGKIIQTVRLLITKPGMLTKEFLSGRRGLRRVFGGSRLATTWKGTLLWTVYVFAILATLLAVGFLSLRGTGPGTPQSEITAPH